jgi:hypothetical protein
VKRGENENARRSGERDKLIGNKRRIGNKRKRKLEEA